MMKPLLAAALAITTISVAAPGSAHARDGWYDRGYADGYRQSAYRDERRYNGGRRYRNQRCYDKGNGGLAIGGIAGALLGREIAGRGDRTLGTILGAGAGALAGRAIDRSDGRRC